MNRLRKSLAGIGGARTKIEAEALQIGVAFPGRREVFEVKATDTVLSLKQKVFEVVGIPVEEQIMVFSNKTLKNSKTLKSYKLQNDRTIMLKGDHSAYIKVKPVDPTLQKLSDRLKKNPPGSKVTKQMKDDPAAQVGEDGTTNAATNTQDAQDAEDAAVLEITVSFSLRFENKLIDTLMIGKTRTAKDLQELVQKVLKLKSLDKHILVFFGAPLESKESLLDEPNKLISELGISEAVIELRATNVTFKVSLPNGEVMPADYNLDDDISKLVDTLLELNLDHPESLVLVREGEQLPLEGTFRQLGITTGSYLDLKRMDEQGQQIKIVVNWGENHTLELSLSPDEEMWDLMRKVEAAGGGNAQKMTLIDGDDNELDDEGTLRDWGVSEGSVLRVK